MRDAVRTLAISSRPAPPDDGATHVERLERLASDVARLSPSHRDPEAYHVAKRAIVIELHRMARRLRHG